jgi:beta-N-acetylhexosaminidase
MPARLAIITLAGALLAALSAIAQPAGPPVGELMVIAFPGREAPVERIRELRPAGIIIYPGNVVSTDQLAGLTRASRAAAGRPLLITIDQEGGPFSSLRAEGVALFPGNMALGATGDESLAEQAGRAIALQLQLAGIDVNFAPVLDVNVNPDNPIIGLRSFGADPALVTRLGVAFLRGTIAGGVLPVAKHFPGHGDTGEDSHLALPSVGHPLPRLEEVELAPFRAAIQAGVPAIMTAHVAFPAVDPDGLPATLSHATLTGLLRERLGFGGAVITDYMDMKAITDRFGAGEAAVRSVVAGADLVLLGPDLARQREVHAALLAAVRSGRITPPRLQAALAASRELRRRAAVAPRVSETQDPAALALEIARRAVTLVWSQAGVLPVREGARLLAVAPRPTGFGADPHLGEHLAALGANVETLVTAGNPTAEQVARAEQLARTADVVIVGTFRWLGDFPAGASRLVQALVASGKPVIAVALGNPDDARFYPARPAAYLASYGTRLPNLRAAAEVILGLTPARGRLPVPVAAYPAGHGLP